LSDGIQVREIAQNLLERKPDVSVRLRLWRDVLHAAPESRELCELAEGLPKQAHVRQLEAEQQPDGSWGRFHSMDASLRLHIPTSEIAIRRALALGLDQNHPILERAAGYMQGVLEGKATWMDRVEKSEGWSILVETITAATLAEVVPAHPAILPAWEYWVEIAKGSFPGGSYVPEAEWQAHRGLRGLGTRYLGSRYVLCLLGSRSACLPTALERRLFDWMWNNPAGIGYLGADLQRPEPFHIFNWLESLEILSTFQCWRERAAEAVAWLWKQRNSDGLWDFGLKVSKSYYFPLSDDWRKKLNRSFDHSTRILVLLSKYDPGI
jgi:hypothetical protein